VRVAARAGFRAILRVDAREAVFAFAAVRLLDRVVLPFRAVAFFFVARGEVPRPFFANLLPPAAAPRRAKVTNRHRNGQAGCGDWQAESGIRSFDSVSMPFDGVEDIARTDAKFLRHLTERLSSSETTGFG
jgi:hypothetical protein